MKDIRMAKSGRSRPVTRAESSLHLGDALRWIDGAGLKVLPDWAQFCLELGAFASQWRGDPGTSLSIALALPIQGFAAGLVAAGYVADRLEAGGLVDQEHVDTLKSLPPEAPVVVRSGNRKFKGRLLGFEYIRAMDDSFFLVQTDQGTVRYIPIGQAPQIEPLNTESVDLPRNSRGYRMQDSGPLLDSLFSRGQAAAVRTRSRLECVILGEPTGPIKSDLAAQMLTVPADDWDLRRGSLQHLVRAKRYLRSAEAYRTLVLSHRSRRVEEFSAQNSPGVTIFDGCQAYLKWADYWRDSTRIVLLCRTDPNFADGVNEINRAYVQDRVTGQVPEPIPRPPRQISLIAFEVTQ